MQNVLIVDPDARLAATLLEFLGIKNIAAKHAGSSQEAVRVADSSPPSLVILELAIPRHNGLAFLQEFRSYTDWNDIPIIVYSHVPIEDTGLTAVEWRKYGVMAYLYKPTTKLANLYHHIQQLLPNYETA